MEAYVDLNADLGEEITDDAGLLSLVTSANVACGYHAGSSAIMRAVCAEAVRQGVTVGAQVSYRDRAGRGRVEHEINPTVLEQQVADQLGALADAARSEGGFVAYLKPHGALYHRVTADPVQAAAVLAGSGQLPVLGMPGSVLLKLAGEAGRSVRHEGFPDRVQSSEGGLVPRDQPGAVLHDSMEIAARALEMAGTLDSVCVHGDSPEAVAHARAVRQLLEDKGWALRSCWLSTAKAS